MIEFSLVQKLTVGAMIRLHCAFEEPPPTGMVAGIAGDQPVKVYPVRDGAVGGVIPVPAA
jgi:hypothetical protein